MAIKSGFFNSVNGDRKYDAKRFAEYFASFIGNGIFPSPSTNLQVASNNDMTVTVKAGTAWINGYICINENNYTLEITPADGVLNRIDRVVLRWDAIDREIRLEVKKGAFASSPVAPSMQRDADAYELTLADITVNKGAISITQANITDLRLSSEYCGIVHGVVDQVDITTLYNQYTDGFQLKQQEFEQEFMMWFATLQDVLDENTASNLLNMINSNTDVINAVSEQTNQAIANTNQVVNTHLADNVTQFSDTQKLGINNTIINKVKALELKTDTRNTTLVYTSGNLTNVVEKNGSTTVKTTTLNYTSGILTKVTEVAGGTTVTTILNYTGGILTSISKAVV